MGSSCGRCEYLAKVKALMEQHKMEQTATLEGLYFGFVNLEPESYQFKKTIWKLVT
jgi:hypothetical protein